MSRRPLIPFVAHVPLLVQWVGLLIVGGAHPQKSGAGLYLLFIVNNNALLLFIDITIILPVLSSVASPLLKEQLERR